MSLLSAVFAAALMLVLASCGMAGLSGTTPDLDGSTAAKGSLTTSNVNTSQVPKARKSLVPEKIVGTAVTGETCAFFEFDVGSQNRTVRVLVPTSSGGYVQNDEMAYEEIIYDLPDFNVVYDSGLMEGTTEVKDGVYYAFQGTYSLSNGFDGYITKIDNGMGSSGFLLGTPIFKGIKVKNYVGAATYLFPTESPQTLLFNATANLDTNEIIGTWCESGVGWGYGIHGIIGGTLNADGTMSLNAAPLPKFEPFLDYPLYVVGEASFQDPARKSVSGYLNLLYGDLKLPSTIVAVKEVN
jgi:hypothetical protein